MDRHFKPLEPGAIHATLSGPLSPHIFDPIFAPQPNAASPLKDLLALAADLSVDAADPQDKVANLPSKKGPLKVPTPPPAWTGLYVGLNAGVAFGGDNKAELCRLRAVLIRAGQLLIAYPADLGTSIRNVEVGMQWARGSYPSKL